MSAGYYRVGTYYVDTTTPSTPVLYRCITAGNKTSSVWAKVSGGGGGSTYADFWSSAVAYAAGSIVQVATTTLYNGITILPGTYVLRQSLSVPASPTYNQIPQFPYPTAGGSNINNGLTVQPYVYWMFIAAMPNLFNTCAGGSSAQIYVDATATF